jgi:hypothetical protein
MQIATLIPQEMPMNALMLLASLSLAGNPFVEELLLSTKNTDGILKFRSVYMQTVYFSAKPGGMLLPGKIAGKSKITWVRDGEKLAMHSVIPEGYTPPAPAKPVPLQGQPQILLGPPRYSRVASQVSSTRKSISFEESLKERHAVVETAAGTSTFQMGQLFAVPTVDAQYRDKVIRTRDEFSPELALSKIPIRATKKGNVWQWNRDGIFEELELDPQRGYLPIRYTSKEEGEDYFELVIIIHDAEKLSTGKWFPKRRTYSFRQAPGNDWLVHESTVSELTESPKADDFKVTIPAGTRLQTNSGFREEVTTSALQRVGLEDVEAMIEQLRTARKDNKDFAVVPPVSSKGMSYSNIGLIGGLLCAAAIGVLAFRLRRRAVAA